MSRRVLITCEHGGNRVPRPFASLFASGREVLASHRGWDPGSLALAKALARHCGAPLFAATVTRLLVELNRSLGHPRLFSEFTAALPESVRLSLVQRYYDPHRRAVEEWITQQVAEGHRVCHVSVHTFTPEFNGQMRRADVGLLYDPRRATERRLCDAWRTALRERRPDLRVRRNYPYLGRSDGFTTYLRKRFADVCYAGIEIEVNQRWPLHQPLRAWRQLQIDVATTLSIAIQGDSARSA